MPLGTMLAADALLPARDQMALSLGWHIMHGLMRTEDAVTDSGYIWASLNILGLVYGGMTLGAYKGIGSMSARWRAGEHDLSSPFGPRSDYPADALSDSAGSRT